MKIIEYPFITNIKFASQLNDAIVLIALEILTENQLQTLIYSQIILNIDSIIKQTLLQ